ncbi:circadian clock protein KaiB [Phaeovibrio sulfidiphilus]|uniref:Circadian clock protein KaiB n=1 Tax=Phaeovibrio sulfidiphilus TaxID=1220600 RepID=A0A8J6YQ77_9PROT|nr:circadian clock KaiB family protein [Phaeovibrio sulfidiphilus]MBE1237267.1 circadian clock protein KaiB [Phaeovibrio sulfidiphilus]
MTQAIHLTLYICGETVRSQNALRAFDRLRDTVGSDATFRVVDVVVDPDEAETARILATPTLVRETPQPQRRVIGDLEDLDQVRKILSLPPYDRFTR